MFEKDEFYKDLMAQEIGKCFLANVGEIDFKEIAESTAIQILEKIQKIILDDEIAKAEKVLYIEDVFLDYGLDISGKYD